MSDTDKKYRIKKNKDIPPEYLLISEVAKSGPYSAEYISLLARRGKIHAKKFGRNWHTTRKALKDYLAKQGVQIILPKSVFASHKEKIQDPLDYPKILEALQETLKSEKEKNELTEKLQIKSTIEEISQQQENEPNLINEWESLEKEQRKTEKLRQQAKEELTKLEFEPEQIKIESSFVKPESAEQKPEEFQAILVSQPAKFEIEDDPEKLKPEEPEIKTEPQQEITEDLKPSFEKESQPITVSEEHKIWPEAKGIEVGIQKERFKFNPQQIIKAVGIAVVVLGIGFGIVWGTTGGFNSIFQNIKTAFDGMIKETKELAVKETESVPTTTPEIIIIDEETGDEIIGEIVSGTTLDSITGTTEIIVRRIDVENADTLDNLDSREFTLAFVTRNGSVTRDNVRLEGDVEVGKNLTVKGALKLAQALTFENGISVSGPAFLANDLTVRGNTNLQTLTINGTCIGCGGGGGGSSSSGSGGLDFSGNVRFDTGSARIFSAHEISGTNAFFGSGDADDEFVVKADATFKRAVTLAGTVTVGNLTATSTLKSTGQTTLSSTSISNLNITGITGSTQCLHVDTNGSVSGTGIDCGSGGGGSGFTDDGTIVRLTNGSDIIGIGTTSPSAKLHIASTTASQIGLIVQATSSQTADILQARNETGTVLWLVSATGSVTAADLNLTGNLIGSNATLSTLAVTTQTTTSALTVSGNTTLANATATSLGLTNPLATSFGGLATTSLAADNQILVSNGTNYVFSTIPTCNISTEKLIFATTTKAWSCEADAGAGGGITTLAGLTDASINIVTGANGLTISTSSALITLGLTQGLNTTSSPTFDTLTLTNDLTFTNGTGTIISFTTATGTNLFATQASTTNLTIRGITGVANNCLQTDTNGNVSGTGGACGSGGGNDGDFVLTGSTLTATTAATVVGIGTTSPQAVLHIASSTASSVVFIAQATSSQTADLLQARNEAGSVLWLVSATGSVTTAGLNVSGNTTLADATATNLGLTNPLATSFGGLATTSLAADNQILVSNGTNYVFSTIPTCNISTEKLIFATTTKSWTCEADAGAGGGITTLAGLTDSSIDIDVGTDGLTLSTSSGLITLGLIQGLNTTSSPTFSNLTITNDLTFTSGTGTALVLTTATGTTLRFQDATISMLDVSNIQGSAIGTDVLAFSQRVQDVAALATTSGNLIIGNGTTWVALGVGTDDFVLTASSSVANGVAWQASIGGTDLSGETFLVISSSSNLTAERILTGSANITLSDGGSSSPLTLDTIQDIFTTSSPTFTGLTLSGLTNGSILFATSSGVISQDNSNFFWDDTNNRLGIGNSNPLTPLHITAGGSGDRIRIQNDSFNDLIFFIDSGGPAISSAGNGAFHFYTDTTAGCGPSCSTFRYAITHDTGYLGYGTETPVSLIEAYSTESSGTQLTITSATSSDPFIAFRTGLVPSTQFVLGVDQSDSNKFKIATSSLGTDPIITIDNAGNIGIGSSSPAFTLAVTGTGKFTSDLIVDGNTTLANVTSTNLGVTSNANIAGNLDVITDATVGGTFNVTGNTTLGNASISLLSITGAGTALDVTNDVTIGGTLNVTGDVTLANATATNLGVTTELNVTGSSLLGNATATTLGVTGSSDLATLTVTGDMTLGNASTDTISVNASFNTHLLPLTDNTYDIGATPSPRWRSGYFGTSLEVGSSSVLTTNSLDFSSTSRLTASDSITYISGLTDTTSAVAFTFETVNAITSGKLLSLRSSTTERLYVQWDGTNPNIVTETGDLILQHKDGGGTLKGITITSDSATPLITGNGGITTPYIGFIENSVSGRVAFSDNAGLNIGTRIFTGSGSPIEGIESITDTFYLVSAEPDGASAVATVIRSANTYSTAGAKLLSVRNNTSEKFSIDLNGVASTSDLIVSGNVTSSTLNVSGNTTLANATATSLALTGLSSTLLQVDGSGNIIAAVADTDYQQVVVWGDGLTYSAPTTSIDFNTTNLKITANQIDTIQGISSAASPTFSNLTITNDITFTNGTGTELVLTTATGTTLRFTNATISTLDVSNIQGSAIGSDVQAWDAQLDDIAALAVTDGNFIVGNNTNWIVESGSTARTSLGLGTGDSPQFTDLTLTGNATVSILAITTQTTTSALTVDGNATITGTLGVTGNTTLANATATSLELTNPLGTAFGGLATTSLPSDNQMLVSNGANYVFSTIPACNTSNQKLIFATTTKSWTCETDAGAGGGITTLAGLTDASINIVTGSNGLTISTSSALITLGLTQGLNTTSSPTFSGVTLSGLTNGSILFSTSSGVVSQDNSNFFWDDTNNRLGLGTSSPTANLDVWGSSGQTALLFNIASSTGTTVFSVASTGATLIQPSQDVVQAFRVLNAAGTEVLTIDTANQRVGIGSTSSPASLLSIQGNSGSTDNFLTIASSTGITFLTVDSRGGFSQNIASGSLSTVGDITDTSLTGGGQAYVSGRYAYVTSDTEPRLSIIDIADPTNPFIVGSTSTDSLLDDIDQVVVVGNYAYVTAGTADNLAVIDVSDPSNPTVVAAVGDSSTMNRPRGLYIKGHYAYIAVHSSGRLVIVDIADPLNPIIVGSVGGTASDLRNARDVYAVGKYAFLPCQTIGAEGSKPCLTSVDISDPTNPLIVSKLSLDNATGTGREIHIVGRYAYVTDSTLDSLSIVDISNPASMSLIASTSDAVLLNGAELVWATDRYVFVASTVDESITVIDISTPSSPTIVASYKDSFNITDQGGLFMAGRHLYVKSSNDKFAIIDIGGIDTPALLAGEIRTTSFNVYDNAVIGNDLYVSGGLNVGFGGAVINGQLAVTGATNSAFFVGNVGIGTTSPASLLDIYSSSSNAQLTITSATSSDPFIAFRTGAVPSIQFVLGVDESDSNKFKIATSSLGTDDVFTIDSSGNVGIGTTTPIGIFSVATSTGASYFDVGANGKVGIGTAIPGHKLDILDGNIRLTQNGAAGRIIVSAQGGTFDPYISFTTSTNDDAGWFIGLDDSDSQSFKIDFANGSGSLGVSDYFVITKNAGDVGIGTSTPASLLEVYATNSTAQLTITSATSTGDSLVNFRTGGVPSTQFVLGIDQSDSNKFKIATSSLGTDDVFVIDSNGNVGIGTSSPAADLHVARNSNDDTEIRLSSSFSGDSRLVFEEAGQGANFAIRYDGSSNQLEFDTLEVDNALVIDRLTGNLGIGTTSPVSKLHIVATSSSNILSIFQATSSQSANLTEWRDNTGTVLASVNELGDITVNSCSGCSNTSGWTDEGSFVRLVTNTDQVGIGATSSTAKLYIEPQADLIPLAIQGFAGQTSVLFDVASSSGTSFLTVASSGRVGIGIATPSALLEVVNPGDTGDYVRLSPNDSSNGLIVVRGNGNAAFIRVIAQNGTVDSYISFDTGNSDDWSVGLDDSDSQKFKISRNLALGTNDYFVIDPTNGNIGIGTTTPASLLDVYSDTVSTQLTITNASSSTTVDPLIAFRTGSVPATQFVLGIDQSDSNKFKIATSSLGTDPIITIDNAGNVGISSSSPAFTLSVNGTGKFTGNLTIDGATTSVQDIVISGICSGCSNTSGWTDDGTFVRLVTNTDQVGIGATSSTAKLYIEPQADLIPLAIQGFAGQASALFDVASSSGTSFLNVASSGNVGIGEIAPDFALDIVRNSDWDQLSISSTMHARISITSDTDSNDNREPTITFRDGTTNRFGIGYSPDYDAFVIAPDSSILLNSSAFVLSRTTGNLGIGTTSPAAKLHIKSDGDGTDIVSIFQATTSQSVNITEWRNNTGTVLASIGSGGGLTTQDILTIDTDGTNAIRLGEDNDVNIGWDGTNLIINPYVQGTGNTIFSLGNIGISTSSPISKLHVVASSSTDIVSIFQATSSQSSNLTEWRDNTGAVVASVATTGDITVNSCSGCSNTSGWTDDGTFVRLVTNTDQVGIGATSSTAKLYIEPQSDLIGLAVQGFAGQTSALFDVASSSGTNLFIIDSLGRVGIGTSSPIGIFSVAIATSSSQDPIFTVGANNRVGINVKNPADTLEVAGDTTISNSGAAAILTIQAGNGTFDPFINFNTFGSSGWGVGLDDSDSQSFKIDFGTSAVLGSKDYFTLTTVGRLGIGTSTPASLLEVYATNSTSQLTITSASANDSLIAFRTEAAAATQFVLGVDESDSNKFKIATSSLGTDDVFVIDANGNVGIGTSSPTANLDIWGASGQTASLFNIASSTGTSVFSITSNGQALIATTSAHTNAGLTIHGTTSASVGVAGIFEYLTINPSATSTFQFGNRFITNVAPTASTTAIGTFIRMIDDTSLANDVRALEVQAYSGTNTAGINTGIVSFGRTFGVQGITTGDAAGESIPAGIFAELRTATSTGNALRVYSSSITSADLVSFYQETSNFSGTGLLMDFANNSATFSGRFLDLKVNGATQLAIASTGFLGIGTTSFDAALNVAGGQTKIEVSTQYSQRLCHSGADGASTQNVLLGDCDGAQADIAEFYAIEGNVEASDVVVIAPSSSNLIPTVTKSHKQYEQGLIGVISTKPYDTFGTDVQDNASNTAPVALVGRVPVKVSDENGEIKAGDYLTSSATLPGYAMKAIQPGTIIGTALESFNDSVGKITVFINVGWWGGNNGNNLAITGDSSSSQLILGESSSSTSIQEPGTWSQGTDVLTVDSDIDFAGYGLLNVKSIAGINWQIDETGNIKTEGLIYAKGDITTEGFFTSIIKVAKNLINGSTIEVVASESRLKVAGPSTDGSADGESSVSYLTFGLQSSREEIVISGSAELVQGEATVNFDPSFTAVISSTTPLKISLTPTSAINTGLYVAEKSPTGFSVKQLAFLTQNGTFDWLVIARRNGNLENPNKQTVTTSETPNQPADTDDTEQAETSTTSDQVSGTSDQTSTTSSQGTATSSQTTETATTSETSNQIPETSTTSSTTTDTSNQEPVTSTTSTQTTTETATSSETTEQADSTTSTSFDSTQDESSVQATSTSFDSTQDESSVQATSTSFDSAQDESSPQASSSPEEILSEPIVEPVSEPELTPESTDSTEINSINPKVEA